MTTPRVERLLPWTRPRTFRPSRSLQTARMVAASGAEEPQTDHPMTDDVKTATSDCDGLCAYLAASQATAITLRIDDIGDLSAT